LGDVVRDAGQKDASKPRDGRIPRPWLGIVRIIGAVPIP
jgi:hypothetical protein